MAGKDQNSFEIVVSADNNNYLAWQCMLFHYSCMTHQGQAPVFIVHGDDGALVEGYQLLQAKGGRIQRLPSYRFEGKIDYVPRNMWGTLKGVKTQADNIVFCDPDMLFLQTVDFPQICAGLKGRAVSLDHVGYMTVGPHNRAILEDVCQTSWVDPKLLNAITTSGGVPHIVPTRLRRRMAMEWATRTEDYLTRCMAYHGKMNSEVWISCMWGFVLAALRNDIPMTVTKLCASNHQRDDGRPAILGELPMVHYCFGDSYFDKRRYMDEQASLNAVWKTTAPAGTISGAIAKALGETAVFFGLN